MSRIPINPKLFTWAHNRAGLDTLALGWYCPALAEKTNAKSFFKERSL